MAVYRYKVKDSVPGETFNVRGVEMPKAWWYTGDQTQPVHAFADFRNEIDGEVASTRGDLENGLGVVFDVSTVPDLNALEIFTPSAELVVEPAVEAPKPAKGAKATKAVDPAPVADPVVETPAEPVADEPTAPSVDEELPA